MRLLKQLIVVAVFGALAGSEALALTTLKKVQITDGSRIDLFFDGKVSEKQVQTEFFKDIIQLSLKDISVYPAKITSVEGMDLTKVFAYQYAPKLVRCRLTVKGSAEDYQNRLEVSPNGKVLSIRILPGSGSDSISLSAAQAMHAAVPGKGGDNSPAAQSKSEPKLADPAEVALLEKVIKGKPGAPVAKPSAKSRQRKAEEPVRLTDGKPLPSPWRSFMVLAVLLGAFAVILAVLKRRGPSIRNHKGLGGLMSGLGEGLSKFGLGQKKKLIEVVSMHHLGPKKSIAVVRIAGRMLVLGVTSESINLITQINNDGGADVDAGDLAMDDLGLLGDAFGVAPQQQKPHPQQRKPAAGAVAAGPAIFADVLGAEASKPANPEGSVRDRIRSRIEGMKQL